MIDELVFAAESEPSLNDLFPGESAWKIMIVDDQEDVHHITRLVLDAFAFEGRPVQCMSAYSGAEARSMIINNPDTAVILLDVVMETNQEGLEVAEFIRSEAGNQLVRIILRTGQAGEAPERKVVTELDINDYRQKAELTADRLVTSVTTAIRSYRDLKLIYESRRGLHLLAMSVAHQVRNRTVTIAGFANIIKRKLAQAIDIEEHLNTILEESTRLEVMVKDVTSYAAIELTQLKPASIRSLVEEAMEMVESHLDDKGVVHWQIFCPDQTVMVERNLSVLALAAIMQNAFDFSEPPATIGVNVSPGNIACEILITDHGSGISEEDMPHIYDPFFSRKPKGSGMGLSVARKVAQEHQWDIFVESKVNEGTSVRIIIPRRDITGVGR